MKNCELKEAKSHGTQDFPVEYYFVTEGASNYVMPLHWHEELEIVRVIHGELLLFLNNEQRLLRDGDIAFISSGMLHRAEPTHATYECLVFSPTFLKKYSFGRLSELLTPLISGDAVITLCERETEEVRAVTDKLLSSVQAQSEFIELRISANVSELIYVLYRDGRINTDPRSSLHKQGARLTIKLVDWIEEHYSERITLDELGAICGLSPKYLCSFFKKMTGLTPMDYVNRLRIEKACISISNGHTSITDAAFDSGFNELSYFSKLFKKYVGCTPSEYKSRF